LRWTVHQSMADTKVSGGDASERAGIPMELSDKFNEIIEFAIDREREAVQFYHDLQEKSIFSEKKGLFISLENIEKGHIQSLNKVKKKGPRSVEVEAVEDLHISDYLVAPPAGGDLSYQDILIIAMKREEASHKLYTDLAKANRNEDTKNLFLKLASEEAKHKLLFEKMYDEEILD
jgi:rubrerythrin